MVKQVNDIKQLLFFLVEKEFIDYTDEVNYDGQLKGLDRKERLNYVRGLLPYIIPKAIEIKDVSTIDDKLKQIANIDFSNFFDENKSSISSKLVANRDKKSKNADM
jgi:hypothetical protein